MISISLMLLAGAFIALSNYLMRKSVDTGGTTKGFLVIQLFVVSLVAVLLNPLRLNAYALDVSTLYLGLFSGSILALMMFSLGRALEIGPAGLTFATLNAATVFPAMILAALLGASYGYAWGESHLIGSLLVLTGLFWAGWNTSGMTDKTRWLKVITFMFMLHVIFLILLSLRAFFHTYSANTFFPSLSEGAFCSPWFMPIAFLTAALIQGVIFLTSEKRGFQRSEILYGILGGCANGIGTFFMIRSTEIAHGFEQMILYPLLSISVIILCNLWGQILYHEHINWRATLLCLLGIVIAGAFA